MLTRFVWMTHAGHMCVDNSCCHALLMHDFCHVCMTHDFVCVYDSRVMTMYVCMSHDHVCVHVS